MKIMGSMMKCKVCGAVMFPDLKRQGAFEELRYRCLKDCRGSEVSAIRRIPGMGIERPVTREDFQAMGHRKGGNKNGGKSQRTFSCSDCGKKVSGFLHPRQRVCPECRKAHYAQSCKEGNWNRRMKQKRMELEL